MISLRHIRRRLGKAVRRPGWALAILRRRMLPFRALARDPDAYQHVGAWTFGDAPRHELTALFPGIEAVDVRIVRAFDRDPRLSVNAAEALALAAIVRFLRPSRILEIGTAHGNTTLNLAANAPEDARVVTLDLPPDAARDAQATVPREMRNAVGGEAGRQFATHPLRTRIEQRFGDSFRLDWNELPGPFDLVYIDGCHHYPYVRRDSVNALAHLRSGGLIVWHDYGMIEDVSRAADELSDRIDVSVVRGTRLALGKIRGEQAI